MSQSFDKSNLKSSKGKRKSSKLIYVGSDCYLEEIFKKILTTYDFMSIVMYQTLGARREFVHDCWLIAKGTENEELKLAVSRDPYFYLTRDDLLALLKTKDNLMITHIL